MQTIFGKQGMQSTVVVIISIAILLAAGQPYQSFDVRGAACFPDIILAEASQRMEKKEDISLLTERLSSIINAVGGDIGIAVMHVETGHTVAIQGTRQLPLYSVFKLPLAIAVLKEIEENRLQLDRGPGHAGGRCSGLDNECCSVAQAHRTNCRSTDRSVNHTKRQHIQR